MLTARRLLPIAAMLSLALFVACAAPAPAPNDDGPHDQAPGQESGDGSGGSAPPPDENPHQLYPEVWSQHSPAGSSYEFKVNCFGDEPAFEACFLYDLDAVRVTAPSGDVHELNRDFNVNDYSGEVTRRWVLYGPPEAALPETGAHLFEYVRAGETVYTQTVDYVRANISFPTGVVWARGGNELQVWWTPPPEAAEGMWYKVLAWNEGGTPDLFISQQFDWDASYGLLEDVPFVDGGTYSLNVAVYYRNGYAFSEYVPVQW